MVSKRAQDSLEAGTLLGTLEIMMLPISGRRGVDGGDGGEGGRDEMGTGIAMETKTLQNSGRQIVEGVQDGGNGSGVDGNGNNDGRKGKGGGGGG